MGPMLVLYHMIKVGRIELPQKDYVQDLTSKPVSDLGRETLQIETS